MHKKMKILAWVLLLSVLFPALAWSQVFCEQENLLALVFDNEDINLAVEPNESFEARLFLLNPEPPCLGGFELSFESTGNVLVTNIELPPYGLNIGSENNVIVGFGQPQEPVDNRILLATLTLLVTDSDPVEFFLWPAQPASIEGQMVILDCNSNLLAVLPISLDSNLPVVRINGVEPLTYCEGQGMDGITVGISCQGDSENLLGASSYATDGYDPAWDLLDTDPEPVVYFYRPDWGAPQDVKFKRDIRDFYYATTETRTWDFIVEASIPEGETAPYDVALDFDPSFYGSEFIMMTLVDHTTQAVTLLEPPYRYNFDIEGDDYRLFSVVVGDQSVVPVETELAISVNAMGPGRIDFGNLAATAPWATDGFDTDGDIPEPGPPPSTYLTASFNYPGWPYGPRFRQVGHAMFDPAEGTKTWPLRVETDLIGEITLNFVPNFDLEDNIPLRLKDESTGEIFDLFPDLSFTYLNEHTSVRDFKLIVGHTGLPDLTPYSRDITPGWNLISLPLTTGPGQGSFQQTVLHSYEGNAYIFKYLGEDGYEQEQPFETAHHGEGYWLGVDNSFTWTMQGDLALEPVTIPLLPGWNLVGYPLWFPGQNSDIDVLYDGQTLSWSAAVEAGLIGGSVLEYETSIHQYQLTFTLSPWQGYWIAGLTEGVSLRFDWENFVELKSGEPEKVEPEGWTAGLTVIEGNGETHQATIGVHPEASAGFDPAWDVPRAPGNPYEIGFLGLRHEDWDLPCGSSMMRDLVSPEDEVITWEAEIMVSRPGPVTLQWQRHDWPADLDLEIYLPSQNRVVVSSMLEMNSVRLVADQGYLIVHVRTPQLSGTPDVPHQQFSLAVHPNPFNPQTTVRFEMPRAGDAEIRFFNLRGEMVSRLQAGTVSAGSHEVVWKGQSFGRTNLPSGSYFGRLYLDGAGVGPVVKMSLVR